MSESFTNDGISAIAQFDNTNGQQVPGSGGAGGIGVRFIFNAETGAYTVETNSAGQTFGRSSLVEQSQAVNVYQVTNGNVTDSLTLTRAGTSGRFNYQYVGAGFFQRTTQQAYTTDGYFVGFTYGVETPDADLPRTGSATYAVDLLGAMTAAGEEGPLSIEGEGTIVANFLSGAIDANARYIEYRGDGSRTSNSTFDGIFSASAQLSASGNTFSGTGFVNGRNRYDGSIDGRFYGPAADEVGAIFSGVDPNGYIAALALIGRQDPDAATPGLADLTGVTTFRTGLISALFNDTGSGLTWSGDPARAAYFDSVRYDADSDTYTFLGVDGYFDYWGKGSFMVGPSDRDSSRDTADFQAYVLGSSRDETQVDIFSGNVNGVELTYSSFARITQVQSDSGGNVVNTAYTYVPFGILTPNDQIPVAGTANYTGRVFGYGRNASDLLAWNLTGTTLLTIDFGAFSVTGTIAAFGNGLNGVADRDFGSFDLSGQVDTTFNGFTGSIDGNGSTTFTGWFFGPNANEFGALFNIFADDAVLEGVTVGTKD